MQSQGSSIDLSDEYAVGIYLLLLILFLLWVHVGAAALLLSPLLDFLLHVFGVELVLAEVLPCGIALLLLVRVVILVRLLVLVNNH